MARNLLLFWSQPQRGEIPVKETKGSTRRGLERFAGATGISRACYWLPVVAPSFDVLCVARVARHTNFNEPVKKSGREPAAKPLKKKKTFFFPRFFASFFLAGERVWRYKQAQARQETKERVESKHRRSDIKSL